jgi:hypothetical protein
MMREPPGPRSASSFNKRYFIELKTFLLLHFAAAYVILIPTQVMVNRERRFARSPRSGKSDECCLRGAGWKAGAAFVFVLIPIYYEVGPIVFRSDASRIEHVAPTREEFQWSLSAERRYWHIACAMLFDYHSSVMQDEQE